MLVSPRLAHQPRLMELKIIAEIAQGFEGSEKLAELFLKAAKEGKADAIKFQIFYADELALPDYRYYALFKNLELPFSFWKKIADGAHEAGMRFYSDIFGLKSLCELEAIGADGFKIHATDINNLALLKRAAWTKKEIFLATGGCEWKEIETAADILSGSPLTLMHGFQAEPTEIGDNHLNRIITLKKFGRPLGFMDHTAGDSDLAFDVASVALGLGVCVIEKHLTLSRKAQMEDFVSALTAEEFVLWSGQMRRLATALGKTEWELTEKEKEYRRKVRRSACSARGLKKGEMLKEEDVSLKRTETKEGILEMASVVGKRLLENVPEGTVLKKEMLA